MAPKTLPSSAADLTPQWLTYALEAAGVLNGVEVSDVTVTPLEEQGSASTVYRLSLRYQGHADTLPQSLVAKLPGERFWRGEFVREVEFYRRFTGDAGLPIARCYFAGVGEQTSKGAILLLEDLLPLVSLNNAGQKAPKHKAIVAALKSVAALHARFWNDASLAKEAFVVDLPCPGTCLASRKLQPIVANALEHHGHRIPESLRRFWEIATSRSKGLEAYVKSQPKTLVHGDMKHDHIFVEPDTLGRAIFLDWAHPAIGPPVADLGGIISHEPQLAQFEDQLLVAYLEGLRAQLESPDDYCIDDLKLARRGWPPSWMSLLSYLAIHDEAALNKEANTSLWQTCLIEWPAEWIERNGTIDALSEMVERGIRLYE